MNFISTEQFGGIVRAVLASCAAYAIGKGWVAASDSEWLVGGVSTAAVAVWSWWSKRPAKAA